MSGMKRRGGNMKLAIPPIVMGQMPGASQAGAKPNEQPWIWGRAISNPIGPGVRGAGRGAGPGALATQARAKKNP